MSVIDEVRREREDLARVLKKHAGIRKIVEDLYPDNAHFIYELLQNAEDTGATEASFRLSKKSAVFEHNGRVFEPRDIYAITDIGEGAKAEDEDKIGCFGVGFKAVFAYSETPEIWSPTFCFRITDLVLPSTLDAEPALGEKTRFEFPFNNPKKPADIAHAEVQTGLNELSETTLLFLSHLESIGWQIDQAAPGEVLRVQHSENHFEMLKQVSGKTTTSLHFLKFDQPVEGKEKHRAAVAFALDFLPNVQRFDHKEALAKQLKIIPAAPARVAIFFPAEKETSGLRFHIHAPFVPELSRASIKETLANQPLFQQLATVTARSLHQIRDMGLLTTDFLSVLPNPQDQIPTRYRDIRAAVIAEMNTKPLTPTHTKSHAPAEHLLQAKAALKDLLTQEDLEFLIDHGEKPLQWATAATQRNSNADRFIAALGITEWHVDSFLQLLTRKASENAWQKPDVKFMVWLGNKPSEWHQQFYALLYKELEPEGGLHRLNDLRIVRLSDGNYSVGSKCFFPGDGVEHDDVLPRADPRVYTSGKNNTLQENARKCLEKIGVREVGEPEQVQAILKQRYGKTNLKPQKGDLNRFILLVEKHSSHAKLFCEHFIFQTDEGHWRAPTGVFLDEPLLDTGLAAYYEAVGKDAKRVALAKSYQDCGIDIKRFVKFAEAVGVRTRLAITPISCSSNPQASYLYSVGGNRYSSFIDRDYVIPHLQEILATPSLAISKLLWQTMYSLPKSPDYLHATY